MKETFRSKEVWNNEEYFLSKLETGLLEEKVQKPIGAKADFSWRHQKVRATKFGP